jgi:hypothetical protein
MPGETSAKAPWPCDKMVATSSNRPVEVTNTYTETVVCFSAFTSFDSFTHNNAVQTQQCATICPQIVLNQVFQV